MVGTICTKRTSRNTAFPNTKKRSNILTLHGRRQKEICSDKTDFTYTPRERLTSSLCSSAHFVWFMVVVSMRTQKG